jgi:hypothetical protein
MGNRLEGTAPSVSHPGIDGAIPSKSGSGDLGEVSLPIIC